MPSNESTQNKQQAGYHVGLYRSDPRELRASRARVATLNLERAAMTKTYEFTTEDIEYLRHGDRALKLRLYKPRGAGPFPAVVDLHGGAWGKGSLEECRGRDEVLAKSGLLVAGLDF